MTAVKVLLVCVLSIASFALGYPQQEGLRVIRPNHYLHQGTLGQHILPQSFYTPHITAAEESSGGDLKRSASENLPQQQQQNKNHQQSGDNPVPVPVQANAGHEHDSYTNIGGVSGSVASALTNTHEYGEIVPKAFSELEHKESYAYYHGQRRK